MWKRMAAFAWQGALWLRAQVPYLYFTRFPLILGLFLLAYGPFAYWKLPTMLKGTLVLEPAAARHVATAAGLAAFTILVTRRVILLYGPERFDTRPSALSHVPTVRQTLGHLLYAVPLLGFVLWSSWAEAPPFDLVLQVCAGLVIALAIFLAVYVFRLLLVAPYRSLPDVLLPPNDLTPRLRRQDLVSETIRSRARKLIARLRPVLGPGYLAEDGALKANHGLALALLSFYVAWYWIYHARGFPGTPEGASYPALGYLLVLATGWTWILGGLGFYLDRYRVPALALLLLSSALISGVSRSDHFFIHHPAPAEATFASPSAIARTAGALPLIVVASDGGGIQAAAWNAQVLTGIQQSWPEFRHALRLVSSVSGGSVGAMYFIGALARDGPPTSADLETARNLAMRQSLNEIGWGLAYPDFKRALVPILSEPLLRDRAWAMERAWARDWQGAGERVSLWARHAAEGWRPAIAFNTTVAENGRRFLISTSNIPDHWHVENFAHEYKGRDLEIVTAARLSATFTYVTPVARAWPEQPVPAWRRHFADAGYFDNTGILTALQWLGDVLRANPGRYQDRPVVVVRIASAPDYEGGEIRNRSAWYQVIAPLVTMISVRQAGQLDRMKSEVEHFREYWCTQGIEVAPITFQFRGNDPTPLSWRLTAGERKAIDNQWAANGGALRDLIDTVSQTPADKCPATLPPGERATATPR